MGLELYEVKISNEALADMAKIYDYIANVLLAPENAMKQYNRIASKILSLEAFPEKFVMFESGPEHSMGIHRMTVDNYLVCYVIDPGVVTVTAVLYGASDVHTRIKERHIENF